MTLNFAPPIGKFIVLREKQNSFYDLAMGRALEINLMRTFVMLVEEQSVTKVARRLNRTQPAISLQIGRLNEAVGRPLFEYDLRHPRRAMRDFG
jgi:hypothetical protein